MKRPVFLLLFFFQLAFAQELKLVSSVPFQADMFVGIDAYKNIYFTKDRVLHKNGPDGNMVYNDLQLGSITSVDILNPLKIVVFYRQTNTVVLLDNRLSEMERINFGNLPELKNIQSATNAGNNSLWIFNIDTRQLEIFDYRSNKAIIISQPISGLEIDQASNFNYCYLLTETKLMTYNRYGSLLLERPAASFEKIVQMDENLIGITNNELFFWAEGAITPVKLNLPELTIKGLRQTQDFLYIYDSENLHTFSLTPPK